MKENYCFELIADHPQKAVIALKENVLGGSDALQFTNCLDELKDKGVKCVIVDCSKVTLMNSSGLGMLIGSLSHLKKFGIALHLASVPAKVHSLLTMTHLDKVFKIFPSLDDAIIYKE